MALSITPDSQLREPLMYPAVAPNACLSLVCMYVGVVSYVVYIHTHTYKEPI